MAALKNTPIVEYHIELGAKMVPTSGWNMPLHYGEGIIAEHRHTRKACSVFDMCHKGEFRIAGPEAVRAMDRLLARPVADLPVGGCRYNFLLDDDGGVRDDLLAFRMADDDLFLVVNAGNTFADANWIRERLPERGAEFYDLSADIAMLDLQGPRSADVLLELGMKLSDLPGHFHVSLADLDGIRCIISRTGCTGELGFEIYFDAEYADQLWDLFLSTDPVMPAGLGARDTLRLEMGYPVHDHELHREWSPFDSGAGSLIDLESERDFIGKAALLQRKATRQLIAVELEGRRASRPGSAVLNERAEIIGVVTSGSFCPTLEKAAALCSIEIDCAKVPGDRVLLEAGDVRLPGTVVERPFYRNGTAKEKLEPEA